MQLLSRQITYHFFMSVVDKHAPMKQKRVKYPIQPEWMSDDIIETMAQRDKFISLGDSHTANIYRNKVTNLIKTAKSNYYQTILDKNKSANDFWRYLKDLNPKQQSKTPSMLKDNENIITNAKDISEHFNSYFANIAKMYVPTTVDQTRDYSDLTEFVSSKVPTNVQFHIPPVSEQWIYKQLMSLDCKKATGPDGLSTRLLKCGAPAISQSLSYLMNFSIQSGKMPSMWKEAKVTPIFKSGSLQDKCNYRPISVLPLVSKLIERHVSNALNTFLENYKLIHESQSGFRNSHSCETALTNLINLWTSSINKGLLNGVIYIDFRKAFDLVDHSIILEKLKVYKCDELSLKWFTSYLLQRTQHVVFDGARSSTKVMDVGVPQGSILGPLFFILFINDMPLLVKNSKLDMYADDSTLTTSAATVNVLQEELNQDIVSVTQWCTNNNMVLNTGKTKTCIITTRQKRSRLEQSELDLSIGTCQLQTTDCDKLLGVLIDKDLNFKTHVKKIHSKVSQSIALLRRIKKFLPINARIKFFNAYIMPHFEYCCTVWGDSTDVTSLCKLQNRVARLILDKPYDFPSSEALFLLKWLPLQLRIKQRKAVMVFKSLNGLLPSYMRNLFVNISEVNTRSTRLSNKNNLYVPSFNVNIYKNSLAVSGAMIWNDIPEKIKNCNDEHSFSKSLYQHYLSDYYKK